MRPVRPRSWLSSVGRAVTCATPEMPRSAQQALTCFTADGLFIALSFAFYNSFLSLYLLGFGAGNSQVGLMTSLSSLSGLTAYVIATRATAALGSRKRMVIFMRVSSRLNLLVLAAVPFFFSGQTGVYVLIGLMCLQALLEAIGSPAWTALVADIVPLSIRARYVASRNIIKSVARTVAVAAAGQIINVLGFPLGFQVALVCGAVIGMGAAIAYSRIQVPESEATPQGTRPTPSRAIGSGFMRYMVARTVWTLGCYLAAPFYPVYLVKSLAGDAGVVGALASVGSIAAVVGLLLFTRLVERRGLRSAWLIGSGMEAVVPWLWAVAPVAWFGVVPAALDGLMMAGLELVNLNSLLLLSPAESRTRHAAYASAALSAAMMVGPLIGGAVSDAWGFRVLFLIAGAMCLVGCALYYTYVSEPEARAGEAAPVAATGQGTR